MHVANVVPTLEKTGQIRLLPACAINLSQALKKRQNRLILAAVARKERFELSHRLPQSTPLAGEPNSQARRGAKRQLVTIC